MEEERVRMKLNIYRPVNLIDAFMLFTFSLSSLSKILEQEQLITLSTLIHCHCQKLWALYLYFFKIQSLAWDRN